MYEDTDTIGNMGRKLGAVIYSPHKIFLSLCFVVILFLVGYAVYNMKYIKGRRSLSIYYENDCYLYSTLKYEGDEIEVIIDTGAQKSILNKDIISIVPYKIYKWISVDLTNILGNTITAQMAKVKRIQFGDCELRNFTFIVSSDVFNFFPELHNVQGIIGVDILKYYDMHFNTNDYILRLEKPKLVEEDPGIWASKELIKEGRYWGFNINIGDQQVIAVIDTGEPGHLIIPAYFQKGIIWNEPTDEELSTFYLWDNKNADGMSRIILKKVRIFDKEFLNFPAVMNPNLNDILIGLDLLSEFDIIISYKRKKIYFKR